MTLWPILKTLYPEGTKAGQCITFAHKFADFRPIGDYLQSKVASVYWHGIMARDLRGNFRVGNLVITRESSRYGHGAIVNTIWGDDLQLTESNYYGDGRVHHGRLLNKYSPLIVGILKVIIKKSCFIRRNDGQISLLTPEGKRFVLSEIAWQKLGNPFAITINEYESYIQAGIIQDFLI